MYFLFIFLFGLIIGSFLNVCIFRIPQNQSILYPRSYCPRCGYKLKTLDLIPVVSYLFLKGRCSSCRSSISIRYPTIELLTAVLFTLCFTYIGISDILFRCFILTSFLIIITFIDIDHQLILDKALIWLAGTGVLINLWLGSLSIFEMLIAALIGGGIMLVIAVASRGGMGGGDIKFAAALGIWLGWKLTLLTLFLAFILGGLGGVIVLLLKLKGRKDYIPFGPFIALGAFISLLYGNQIINWYITNFL